ncbi:MAG: hypothetical protein Ct9H300mP16_05640 [Pseudomonadota bacterium]|nr:MAG: hypothetical protein Ct9H300mP16_05640 [Pseudomonadota bacterium]
MNRDPISGRAYRGSGGILVELIDDALTLPVPVSSVQARNLLKGLRGWALLEGFRGRPASDVEALVQLIVAVSRYAAVNARTLRSLDLIRSSYIQRAMA